MESVGDEVSQLGGWDRLPGRGEIGGGWGELWASEQRSDEGGCHFGGRFMAVVAILKVKNTLVVVEEERKPSWRDFAPNMLCFLSRIKHFVERLLTPCCAE